MCMYVCIYIYIYMYIYIYIHRERERNIVCHACNVNPVHAVYVI
jgi:hypothetical protein